MKSKRKLFSAIIALLAVLGILAGCTAPGQPAAETTVEANSEAGGGTILLKVNPEIAVRFNEDGIVTDVFARNSDAQPIVAAHGDLTGQEATAVIRSLLGSIHDAGYLIDDLDGERRQITIELEQGSIVPSDTFMEKVVDVVQKYISGEKLRSDLTVWDDTDFSLSDYDASEFYGSAYDSSLFGVSDYSDYGRNFNALSRSILRGWKAWRYRVTRDYDNDSMYDDSMYDDSMYDDSMYENATPDDSMYDDSMYENATPDDSMYDDSPYDSSNDDDSLYDYDDSIYDDSLYDDSYYAAPVTPAAPVPTAAPAPPPTAAPAPPPTAAPAPVYDDSGYSDYSNDDDSGYSYDSDDSDYN
jgi:hypothetical protein